MDLETLGFSEPLRSAFESSVTEPAVPGRVSAVHRERYRVATAAGSCEAQLAGKLRFTAELGAQPVVGDWVALRQREGAAQIIGVLPRRGTLVRKQVDRAEPQLIAANLDRVFVVSSLNADFQPRRIERALAMIWEAGAEPVIVLTKLDLCPDWSAQRRALSHVALGVRVYAVSAQTGEGMDALEAELAPRCTIALIGSSGTGKSTLTNRWLGAPLLPTQAVREHDDRGRHTTTHRELFVLPSGALLIDTPGMRELALWDAESGLDTAFADIEALAHTCRFADCQHQLEPGCGVKSALARGELDAKRYENYRKLQRELAYTQRQQDERARGAHQRELRGVQRQRTRALRARKPFE